MAGTGGFAAGTPMGCRDWGLLVGLASTDNDAKLLTWVWEWLATDAVNTLELIAAFVED